MAGSLVLGAPQNDRPKIERKDRPGNLPFELPIMLSLGKTRKQFRMVKQGQTI